MIDTKLSFLFMISTTTAWASAASVASVSRAMRVLDAFASHPAGVALTSLSAELGYGKASLSKILATMAREGFVRRDPVSAHFPHGYAVVDEELVDGGRAVAAPILKAGHVVAAVAVSGPTSRLPVAKLHRLAPIVRRAAAELEAVWVPHVTARDFGLGVRPPNGNRRARASQAGR